MASNPAAMKYKKEGEQRTFFFGNLGVFKRSVREQWTRDTNNNKSENKSKLQDMIPPFDKALWLLMIVYRIDYWLTAISFCSTFRSREYWEENEQAFKKVPLTQRHVLFLYELELIDLSTLIETWVSPNKRTIVINCNFNFRLLCRKRDLTVSFRLPQSHRYSSSRVCKVNNLRIRDEFIKFSGCQ